MDSVFLRRAREHLHAAHDALRADDPRFGYTVRVEGEDGALLCYPHAFAEVWTDPDGRKWLWILTEHWGDHVVALDEVLTWRSGLPEPGGTSVQPSSEVPMGTEDERIFTWLERNPGLHDLLKILLDAFDKALPGFTPLLRLFTDIEVCARCHDVHQLLVEHDGMTEVDLRKVWVVLREKGLETEFLTSPLLSLPLALDPEDNPEDEPLDFAWDQPMDEATQTQAEKNMAAARRAMGE